MAFGTYGKVKPMMTVGNPVTLAASSLRETAENFADKAGRLARLSREEHKPLLPLLHLLAEAAALHADSCREMETLLVACFEALERGTKFPSTPVAPPAMANPREPQPCGQFLLSEKHFPFPVCSVCGWREAAHDRLPAPDRTRDSSIAAPADPQDCYAPESLREWAESNQLDFAKLVDSPRAAETLASLVGTETTSTSTTRGDSRPDLPPKVK